MRILYLSCHAILEYDELRLFHELGCQVFSPGAYQQPDQPQSTGRLALPCGPWHLEMLESWRRVRSRVGHEYAGLPREFVEQFDVIVVMGMSQPIVSNRAAFRGKAVVWRTIGQSRPAQEESLRPYRRTFKVVRYSPKEFHIPGNIGCDAMLRFYKDPDEYGNWNGQLPQVLAACNSLCHRPRHCNYDFWRAIQQRGKFPVVLYGSGNEDIPASAGFRPVDELTDAYRNSAAYISLGTHPASYTLNFLEAWITGVPVLAVGPRLGNRTHDLYEVPDLIWRGETGFWTDNVDAAVEWLQTIIDDRDYARRVSAAARATAIPIFGKQAAMSGWRSFLNTL